MDTKRVEISYKTIIFVAIFILSLWLIFLLRGILMLIFLSFIVAAGMRSPVEYLEDHFRLPRTVAILISYVVFLSLLFLLFMVMIPAFAGETVNLVQKIQIFFAFPAIAPYVSSSLTQLSEQLSGLTSNVFRATLGAFSIIINFFTMLVLTFYLLLERRHMRVFLKNMLGEDLKERVVNVILKIEERLGSWVRGELSLILVIGIMSYVGLLLLNIEYALPLAIFAGLLEVIPIVGPIISAIPAIIIAISISSNPWIAALAVGGLYFLIQQLENHLIVPVIMKQSVGIPPVITIVAILVGGELGGVVGALLSIPIFICLQILFQEFFASREEPFFPKGK